MGRGTIAWCVLMLLIFIQGKSVLVLWIVWAAVSRYLWHFDFERNAANASTGLAPLKSIWWRSMRQVFSKFQQFSMKFFPCFSVILWGLVMAAHPDSYFSVLSFLRPITITVERPACWALSKNCQVVQREKTSTPIYVQCDNIYW